MRVTRKSRIRVRIENILFVLLVLAAAGLLGWLSTRYHLQADWTAGGRNTLSPPSRELLARLDGPVHISAYAREDPVLRDTVRELVGRYQRHKDDITLQFVNPDTVPDRVRELGITVDGELIIEYGKRREHLLNHSEQAMTNTLQRVARAGERWLAFVSGHGERSPRGRANHDLGELGKQLEQRGFNLQELSLAEAGEVPDNTAVLVIAGPRVAVLPGEAALIQEYLAGGGNLLWLTDPGAPPGLEPVAEALGLERVPGVVVDPTTALFGIEHPAVALVTGYPAHPVTRDFSLLTLFPEAAPLLAEPPEPWRSQVILSTAARAWAETGELAGEVRFDEDSDVAGPLDIGIAFTRPRQEEQAEQELDDLPARAPPQQRVAVIGDGDFLSNAFLGNSGNLDLGLNVINWLASDDALIAIPAKTAPDLSLTLSRTEEAVVALGSLVVLPLLLLGTGVGIWYRRRKR